MAALSTDNYWGSSEIPQIPVLGEYYPGGINVAECIIVSGDSDGTPTATSDSDADFMIDTVCEIDIFNIEGGSDTDATSGGVWIIGVQAMIVTAFTATVNIQLGDCDDSDGWAAEAGIGATSTSIVFIAGSDDADVANFAYSHVGGKFYGTSSGNMKLTVDTADPAVGRLAVYALYYRCARSSANR